MSRSMSLALLFFAAVPSLALAQDEMVHTLPEPMRDRTEFGFIPLVGGDSDFGIAVGTIGSVAHMTEFAKPYEWRLELNGMISFLKPRDTWVIPFQDYYVKISVPSLMHNRLRLAVRIAYTKYGTLRYFGLGNASPRLDMYSKYSQFQLSYPHGTFELNYGFAGPLALSVAADYFYERTGVYQDSKLEQDLQSNSKEVTGAGAYSVGIITASLVYDSRDDGVDPNSGQNHAVSARVSPGPLFNTPYKFVGVYAALRGYIPLWRPYFTLALRLAGDALIGDVPFYMLAESADGYAVGGINGVRGVPAQRYYGKGKAYGTAELRVSFPSFRAFSQNVTLGMVAFGDTGRVWAGLRHDPVLDGTGIGLKYGVGGGIRVRLGETFLLRGDAAYSPDAQPMAFYFNVGHAF